MRYLIMALGVWFSLEMVFVAVLVVVSAIEGHTAKRQAAATARTVLVGSEAPLDHLVGAREHRTASA